MSIGAERPIEMDEMSWVLVVDPDSKAVEAWRSCLAADRISVEQVSSVKEAATKLKDLRCGCMVVDVDLPEMKGYNAVPILKAIQPHTKVIMTARRNSKDLETNVRRQDVFYYHIKSFSSSELASAVRIALQAGPKGQSNAES